MSKTVQDIKTYLQLLNIPNNKINTIINRDDIAVYSELEAEIQKHIDTNFICVNHQVKVINGVEAEHLYFLNEK